MTDYSISIISEVARSGDKSMVNVDKWGEHVTVLTGADRLPTVVACSGWQWIEYGQKVQQMYVVGTIPDLHESVYLANGMRSVVDATWMVGGCQDIGDVGNSGHVGT